jgi:hypothetical protein
LANVCRSAQELNTRTRITTSDNVWIVCFISIFNIPDPPKILRLWKIAQANHDVNGKDRCLFLSP